MTCWQLISKRQDKKFIYFLFLIEVEVMWYVSKMKYKYKLLVLLGERKIMKPGITRGPLIIELLTYDYNSPCLYWCIVLLQPHNPVYADKAQTDQRVVHQGHPSHLCNLLHPVVSKLPAVEHLQSLLLGHLVDADQVALHVWFIIGGPSLDIRGYHFKNIFYLSSPLWSLQFHQV